MVKNYANLKDLNLKMKYNTINPYFKRINNVCLYLPRRYYYNIPETIHVAKMFRNYG